MDCMKLNSESLKNTGFWKQAGITLPQFDRNAMIAATNAAPKWVHFGAGNIFRAFPAALAQSLLERGSETTGIIAAEGYDEEIIEKSFAAFDNLSILVTLKSDGTIEKKVIAPVAMALNMSFQPHIDALRKIFASPSLQMASFTITEKGYSLYDSKGIFFSDITEDLTVESTGNEKSCKSFIGKIALLLLDRYEKGAFPIAMVSMDNCSHNGDVLFNAVKTFADVWAENGTADKGFLNYISDKTKVSFPWTMIDKITPWPDYEAGNMLTSCGLEDMNGIITAKNTYIAPFVNAEETQYLVIEDAFPNGRPALEKAGVLFTDRQTVEKVERMKVCTCLNPLHTALAIFGTLLGYELVRDTMKDTDLVKLIEGIGYNEGLPVVTDPLIINPKEFLKEVIEVRLPNPFIPDTLRRIAIDSSLKIPIRFGETIKAYIKAGKDCTGLKHIPLVFAGWLRYHLGIDDDGRPFEISPDPGNETIKAALAGFSRCIKKKGNDIEPSGKITSCQIKEKLKPVLSNTSFFGVDLYAAECGLGQRVESYFMQMLTPKSVRRILSENLT